MRAITAVADPDRFTLDTSALVAYLEDEPGADRVQDILFRSDRGSVRVFASFMTYMEVLYGVWRCRGEREAKGAYLRLKALPMERMSQNERLLVTAARIKASCPLSVADAWIAATARETSSTLVHKDPEFRSLRGEVPLLELPLKGRRPTR